LYDSFELRKQEDGKPNELVDGPSAPVSRQKPAEEPPNWLPIAAVLVLAAALVLIRVIRRRSRPLEVKN
jgi:hypothetical protein